MPYDRRTLFATPLLTWQTLRLQEALPHWSADYRPDSARLLLPVSDCFECALTPESSGHGTRFVCDSAAALWLTPARSYRMRQPRAGQRSHLLCLHGADAAAAGRRKVSLSQHLALRRWQQALFTGQAEPLAVEEALLGLLQHLLDAPADDGTGVPRAVERARELLASDPARGDTLAEIARAVHASPFHLARQFRRHTGASLHGFRTRLRITLALQRLAQGERDLTRLALDLGYASHSHFSAAFRRTVGATPSAMRTFSTAPPPG
ncbi:helix-turn-helix transcriptional regulator [Aquincola sp. S2]|uniref:Helix-turn-helix transcriptional regulator n=1 Tax=Pseudaquabacterium terrae TaxID=2732868 RepID=A0ABX2EA11_9BURK|nr:AraC family transcriptional regulator [Aquabacterium terrae]NRF65655.1 helix-turn-helix transcriptional regulator [Aquabacterium terrae]